MDDELFQFDQNIITIIQQQGDQTVEITKFNKEKLKLALQITGIKISHSVALAEEVFGMVFEGTQVSEQQSVASLQSPKTTLAQKQIEDRYEVSLKKDERELKIKTLSLSELSDILTSKLVEKHYVQELENKRKSYMTDFILSCEIIEKKTPFIILLGGTSGSGKSTLGSILAALFGISTALSTDSIRQIMRNFYEPSQLPLLFASTYEAGKYLEIPTSSEQNRQIKGYKEQCILVQERLEKIIEQHVLKRDPLVIEGVHLTPQFMFETMKKYHNVVAFTVYIKDEKKHKERFAVRSKYMTLEKKFNKYVDHFQTIRLIQKWFLEKADRLLIPKVNNINIDRSLATIHKSIMQYQRKVYMNKIQFKELQNFLPLYNIYNKVTKNILSEDTVKQLIDQNLESSNFKNRCRQEKLYYASNKEDSLLQSAASQVQSTTSAHQNSSQHHSHHHHHHHQNPISTQQMSLSRINSNSDDRKSNAVGTATANLPLQQQPSIDRQVSNSRSDIPSPALERLTDQDKRSSHLEMHSAELGGNGPSDDNQQNSVFGGANNSSNDLAYQYSPLQQMLVAEKDSITSAMKSPTQLQLNSSLVLQNNSKDVLAAALDKMLDQQHDPEIHEKIKEEIMNLDEKKFSEIDDLNEDANYPRSPEVEKVENRMEGDQEEYGTQGKAKLTRTNSLEDIASSKKKKSKPLHAMRQNQQKQRSDQQIAINHQQQDLQQLNNNNNNNNNDEQSQQSLQSQQEQQYQHNNQQSLQDAASQFTDTTQQKLQQQQSSSSTAAAPSSQQQSSQLLQNNQQQKFYTQSVEELARRRRKLAPQQMKRPTKAQSYLLELNENLKKDGSVEVSEKNLKGVINFLQKNNMRIAITRGKNNTYTVARVQPLNNVGGENGSNDVYSINDDETNSEFSLSKASVLNNTQLSQSENSYENTSINRICEEDEERQSGEGGAFDYEKNIDSNDEPFINEDDEDNLNSIEEIGENSGSSGMLDNCEEDNIEIDKVDSVTPNILQKLQEKQAQQVLPAQVSQTNNAPPVSDSENVAKAIQDNQDIISGRQIQEIVKQQQQQEEQSCVQCMKICQQD